MENAQNVMKSKKCQSCKSLFFPRNSLQKACSIDCAVLVANKIKENKEKKEILIRKEAIKSRSDHLKEAQTVMNQYIRLRDFKEPCISCQRHHEGQYHAGHYLAVGSHPELRFNELNNNKQCSVCNNYLSGNQIEYRKHLIDKIGLQNVEWLECKHEPKKYSVEEIKDIKNIFKLKLKELKSKI